MHCPRIASLSLLCALALVSLSRCGGFTSSPASDAGTSAPDAGASVPDAGGSGDAGTTAADAGSRCRQLDPRFPGYSFYNAINQTTPQAAAVLAGASGPLKPTGNFDMLVVGWCDSVAPTVPHTAQLNPNRFFPCNREWVEFIEDTDSSGMLNADSRDYLATSGTVTFTKLEGDTDAGAFWGWGTSLHFDEYDHSTSSLRDGGACLELDQLQFTFTWP